MTVTPRMLRRAVITALLVGGVLFAVNSGDAVARQGLTAVLAAKLGVTMLIPFVVSLTSSAMTRRELGATEGRGGDEGGRDVAGARPTAGQGGPG